MSSDTPRLRRGAVIGVLACLLVAGCAAPADSPDSTADPGADVIYQTSTLQSLLEGSFEGSGTVGDLTQHGTLGLGTVDRLDGELIVVDGTAYAARNDGSVDTLRGDTGVPFGAVIPFEADTTFTLSGVDSFADFQSRLGNTLPAENQLYAFRVTGTFDQLRTRSVPAQQPPYPPLADVIANQTEFAFEDAAGTMVGFHVPAVFDGVTTTEHHAHFVTASRDGGGHVLALRAARLEVQINHAASLQVALPDS